MQLKLTSDRKQLNLAGLLKQDSLQAYAKHSGEGRYATNRWHQKTAAFLGLLSTPAVASTPGNALPSVIIDQSLQMEVSIINVCIWESTYKAPGLSILQVMAPEGFAEEALIAKVLVATWQQHLPRPLLTMQATSTCDNQLKRKNYYLK